MSGPVRIGVLRLVDSAPIVVAERRGIFRTLGIDVRVQVEPSWSNLADKLSYGLLQAAVLLPPLAMAATLGLRGPKARLLVPLSISQGGNAIAMATDAAAAIEATGGIRAWLQDRREPPRLAVVHAFSTHNLLLRYWLAASGVDPDRDVETVVIPPETVVDALAAGEVAGFCAGAPWGDVAARNGAGRVLFGTSHLWPHHPEKCLAVGQGWADANGPDLSLLLRGILQAQRICDCAEEAEAVAALLAAPEALGLPLEATRAALAGGDGTEQIRFHGGGAWMPARPHALWFLRQMQRWRWIGADEDLPAIAETLYRPDLAIRAALAEGMLPPPPLEPMPETELCAP